MSSSNASASGSKCANAEVDGYIHNVSDIRVAKSGTRYFDFSVQENERQMRVVCFSPEKRSTLKEREQSRSPVTLANVSPQKRKYDPESTEYTMSKYSRVINKKNLSFPWKPFEAQDTGNTVIAISEIVSAAQSNGNLVAVKGKIVSKSPPETIYSHTMRKSLNKVDAIVADSTSAIRLTLWQNNIHDVEEGACYLFENLRVSFYQRNYLATTTRTTSKQIEEPSNFQKTASSQ
jgi:ssDNA-binding replication factor A large subunit